MNLFGEPLNKIVNDMLGPRHGTIPNLDGLGESAHANATVPRAFGDAQAGENFWLA